MVAYVLGITNVDPLQFDLLFERFLNPERISWPDVDVDFDERRRGEVIRYVTEKYGEDRVSMIVTYGTIKAKQAVKDSSRILGYPFAMGDRITKAMPAAVIVVAGRSTTTGISFSLTAGGQITGSVTDASNGAPVSWGSVILERAGACVRIDEVPAEVQRAAAEFRPLHLTNIAYEIARAFTDFYNACPVLKAEPQVRDFRLRLVAAAKQTLANALTLLGITAPEVM